MILRKPNAREINFNLMSNVITPLLLVKLARMSSLVLPSSHDFILSNDSTSYVGTFEKLTQKYQLVKAIIAEARSIVIIF